MLRCPRPHPRGLYFAPRVAPRTNSLRAAQPKKKTPQQLIARPSLQTIKPNKQIISLVCPLILLEEMASLDQSGGQNGASFLDPCLQISSFCATGVRQAF